jgi:hypothetical protein
VVGDRGVGGAGDAGRGALAAEGGHVELTHEVKAIGISILGDMLIEGKRQLKINEPTATCRPVDKNEAKSYDQHKKYRG